jgi:hypothetical protein
MSGYLTKDGIDLSNLFLPIRGGTFTGVITTNAGIIGPSTSIAYDSNTIGHRNIINGIGSISIGTGTITTISSGFTIPIGVFVVTAHVDNTYSNVAGVLNSLNICVSTSSGSNTGNLINIPSTITSNIPSGGTISGTVTYILTNTSSQTYYLNETITFSTFTSVSSSSTSYVSYMRIA